ncbi:MAG: uroporphyrinogen decarboxylase family protein [bacterium]
MTKRERVLSAVRGDSVDRIPFSFWYHFRWLEFPSGEPLAEEELRFYNMYDPDFLKVMHDIPYELPEGISTIKEPEDWYKLDILSADTKNFSAQRKALDIIIKNLPDDGFVIDTIFSTFAYAEKLTGKKTIEHLKNNPRALHFGLEVIARSLANFIASCRDIGLSGIYMALQGANRDIMDSPTYRQHFMPYDMIIWESARGFDFNILHLHGYELMFDIVKVFNPEVITWSNRLTPPSLESARSLFNGCIATGLNEEAIINYSSKDVKREVLKTIVEAGAKKLIVAPGCAVPTETPKENLLTIKEILEDLR